MELNKQVVSLELAKRLKELGVKQESLFYWSGHEEGQMHLGDSSSTLEISGDPFNGLDQNEYRFVYSAFTVAELGEIDKHCTGCRWNAEEQKWISYKDTGERLGRHDTEADARGLMLCYLIENAIIKI